MPKQLVLVHGRSYKPEKKELQKLWIEALKFGLERDRPDVLKLFSQAKIHLAYYGDISNDFLSGYYDEPIDTALDDRKESLDALKHFSSTQFNKFTYRSLPGYNPWKEFLADLTAAPLDLVRLSDPLIAFATPDVQHYWHDHGYGSKVRKVCTDVIIQALKASDEVCVIGHSMGSMITYDIFWKLSHYGEYRGANWNHQIDRWITIGSPLGNETVKRKLKGANEEPEYKYPTNVKEWYNVAAHDDYVAHDQTVSGDYREMKRLGYVERIHDKRIYNLAVRNGKSNPHNGVGYLIHPHVIELVATWLESGG